MSALEETLVRFQHHGGTNTSEILKAIEQDNPESVRRIGSSDDERPCVTTEND